MHDLITLMTYGTVCKHSLGCLVTACGCSKSWGEAYN